MQTNAFEETGSTCLMCDNTDTLVSNQRHTVYCNRLLF